MTEMANDVLHHDDGAFDDHAEVQRAEREEIGGDVAEVEADGGEQQREGDGDGDDQGAAQVPEEEEEDDDDQDDALGQVVEDGAVVRWRRSLRSRNGTIFTPGGRM